MKKLIKLDSDFSDAKVGDKVTSFTYGKGVIIQITDLNYNIVCEFSSNEPAESFTMDGKYYTKDVRSTLFKGHHDNLAIFKEVEDDETISVDSTTIHKAYEIADLIRRIENLLK